MKVKYNVNSIYTHKEMIDAVRPDHVENVQNEPEPGIDERAHRRKVGPTRTGIVNLGSGVAQESY